MRNRLVFVRHGQSEHHVEDLTGGWTDTPLTITGRQQVSRTATYLKELALPVETKLYSSDLKRAWQSAVIIGEQLSVEPKALPKLRELNNGDAAGLTTSEAAQIKSPPPTSPLDYNWRPYPNAESWHDLTIRMKEALDELLSPDGHPVLVVGHGLSGQALLRAWLKVPIDIPLAFHFGPASVTELQVNEWDEPEILRLNIEVG